MDRCRGGCQATLWRLDRWHGLGRTEEHCQLGGVVPWVQKNGLPGATSSSPLVKWHRNTVNDRNTLWDGNGIWPTNCSRFSQPSAVAGRNGPFRSILQFANSYITSGYRWGKSPLVNCKDIKLWVIGLNLTVCQQSFRSVVHEAVHGWNPLNIAELGG